MVWAGCRKLSLGRFTGRGYLPCIVAFAGDGSMEYGVHLCSDQIRAMGWISLIVIRMGNMDDP